MPAQTEPKKRRRDHFLPFPHYEQLNPQENSASQARQNGGEDREDLIARSQDNLKESILNSVELYEAVTRIVEDKIKEAFDDRQTRCPATKLKS